MSAKTEEGDDGATRRTLMNAPKRKRHSSVYQQQAEALISDSFATHCGAQVRTNLTKYGSNDGRSKYLSTSRPKLRLLVE